MSSSTNYAIATKNTVAGTGTDAVGLLLKG